MSLTYHLSLKIPYKGDDVTSKFKVVVLGGPIHENMDRYAQEIIDVIGRRIL